MRTIVMLLIIPPVAFAGFERTMIGARASGMGSAFVALSNDGWGLFYNPAGLATINRYEASIYYSPSAFGLSELSLSAAIAVLPTSIGSFGIGLRRYGFELYREMSGTLSYSNILSDLMLGVNLNYHSVSIVNYGSAGTIGIDVGAKMKLLEDIDWGISIKNGNAPTIGSAKEELPQVFSTGIAYFPIVNLTLAADYRKEVKRDGSLRFGTEYRIIDEVALRAGTSRKPIEYYSGLGVRYSVFQFDYAYEGHQELGGTHHLGLTIRWGRKNE